MRLSGVLRGRAQAAVRVEQFEQRDLAVRSITAEEGVPVPDEMISGGGRGRSEPKQELGCASGGADHRMGELVAAEIDRRVDLGTRDVMIRYRESGPPRNVGSRARALSKIEAIPLRHRLE